MTGEECRDERQRLGVTVERLALRAGLCPRTVLRFEMGETQARPVTLIALRKGLRLLREGSRP